MSAIAGIWDWDGRPISDNALDALAEHNRPAGPDGSGTVKPIPGLALQAHVMRFDSLSSHEHQPYIFANESVLTWDGRLDNRDDLLLRLHHDIGPDSSDAAVVAAAYSHWGTDCFPRLIGDWSLAIWNSHSRQLILARDYIGNRPLYYLTADWGLAWSTRLDALAKTFNLYGTPDETYIAGALTFGPPPGLTPFQGARALIGGHTLVATKGHDLAVRRYWKYEPRTIRYRRAEEYTDHLRELLTDAVRVRLRANGTVWSHLSGGWDSSSVVCIANELVRRRRCEASRLQPLSYFSSSSPETDGSKYIAAVERWCGLKSLWREFPRHPTFAELRGKEHPFETPEHLHRDLPVVAAGDRILLAGNMGDLVMLKTGASTRLALLEPLQEGHPLRFLRLCALRGREKNLSIFKTLAHLAFEAYVPSGIHHALAQRRDLAERATVRGVRSRSPLAIFGVTPQLLARVPPYDNRARLDLEDFPVVKRPLVAALYRIAESGTVASSDYFPRIWRTFPFVHRPLVEYVIGVPHTALWDPVLMRAGMKRALADVLPNEILGRSGKGSFAPVQARLLRDAFDELIGFTALSASGHDWELVKRGYVDAHHVADSLNEYRAGHSLDKLRMHWLDLEAWLRTLTSETNRAHSAPMDVAAMQYAIQRR